MSFRIQRGIVDIVGDGGGNDNVPQYATLTAGVDYVAPNPTRAFFRLTNTRHGSAGQTVNSLLDFIRAYMTWVSDPTRLDQSVQIARGGDDGITTRAAWEIVEYTGAIDGPDEFLVRQRAALTCTSGNLTVDGSPVGVGSISRCAVVITGQSGDIRVNNGMARCQFTAELVDNGDGTVTPRFTRGSSTDNAYVSYVIVEFKGANWRDVQRIETSTVVTDIQGTDEQHITTGNDVDIPIDLLDAQKAFLIDAQCRTSGNLNNSMDAIYLVPGLHPTAISGVNTNASYLRRSAPAAGGTRVCVAWLVESLSDDIFVTHEGIFLDNGGAYAEPQTINYPLGFDAIDYDRAMLAGITSTADGAVTQSPVGSINLRLTDAGHVELYRNDTIQEEYLYFSVVNLPGAVAADTSVVGEDEPVPPEAEAVLTSPLHEADPEDEPDHEAVQNTPQIHEADLI